MILDERLVLNEAPEDNAQPSASVSSDSSSKDAQYRQQTSLNKVAGVENQKLASADAKETQQAFDNAKDYNEEERIIRNFVTIRFANKFGNDVLSRIDPIYDALDEEIRALGFDENNNLMIKFVDRVIGEKNITMTSDQYDVIHNLYADGHLDDNDMTRYTRDGYKNILYNGNLYKVKDADDFKWYLMIYNWCQPANVDKIEMARPIVGGKERDLKKDYKDFNSQADINLFRTHLIFNDAKGEGSLRDINQIKAEMTQMLQPRNRRLVQNDEKNGNEKTNNTKSQKAQQAEKEKANQFFSKHDFTNVKDALNKVFKRTLSDKELNLFAKYMIDNPNEFR